jgi:hypothetical protein
MDLIFDLIPDMILDPTAREPTPSIRLIALQNIAGNAEFFGAEFSC